MKIGLFGGSFNPVHHHHMAIARAALTDPRIEQVKFLPVFAPVHKSKHELAPFALRMAMLQAATRDQPGMCVDDLERRLGGESYTVRLVEHLRRNEPQHQYVVIIGSDMLRNLPKWREGQRLLTLCPFAVFHRPGIPTDIALPNADSFFIGCPQSNVSSSDIRRSLQSRFLQSQPLQSWKWRGLPVPASVLALIVRHGAYSGHSPSLQQWLSALSARLHSLPGGLQAHIERTAILAAEYALEQGVDPELAVLAGLAHDLFRLAPAAEILAWSTHYPGQLSALERSLPMLAHGIAAAGFLHTLTPAVPPEVIDAVRRHTFPHLRANPITKVLVLGDTLDPGRGCATREKMRRIQEPVANKYRRVVTWKRRARSAAATEENCPAPAILPNRENQGNYGNCGNYTRHNDCESFGVPATLGDNHICLENTEKSR